MAYTRPVLNDLRYLKRALTGIDIAIQPLRYFGSADDVRKLIDLGNKLAAQIQYRHKKFGLKKFQRLDLDSFKIKGVYDEGY